MDLKPEQTTCEQAAVEQDSKSQPKTLEINRCSMGKRTAKKFEIKTGRSNNNQSITHFFHPIYMIHCITPTFHRAF
jgi:hypothetical protein